MVMVPGRGWGQVRAETRHYGDGAWVRLGAGESRDSTVRMYHAYVCLIMANGKEKQRTRVEKLKCQGWC